MTNLLTNGSFEGPHTSSLIQSGEHIKALQALRDAKHLAGEWLDTQEEGVFYGSVFRQTKRLARLRL